MDRNVKAYLSLFGGLSFMSFAAIFMRVAHAPGIVTAFYRMVVADAVLLFPFIFSLRKNHWRIPGKGVLYAVFGGLCFGGDMAFWASGVVMSNATIPTLMANLAPVWVGLGTMLFFGQKHKKGFWLGLTIAILGVLLLVHKDIYGHRNFLLGALLGFCAGIFYGAFYIFSEPGRKLLDTLQYLFISTLSSAALLTLCMLFFGYHFTGYDRLTYFVFLGIGLGVQVCGWFLINYSQGFLPAAIVSPTLLGQPVLTAILAILLLGEKLTVWHISGGLVVVAGIYLVHFSSRKNSS